MRLENDQRGARLQLLRVNEAISRSVEAVRGTAEANGVGLCSEPSGAWVVGDVDRLVQVLVNLLSNAVKSSPRGGSVRIAAIERGEEVELRVGSRGSPFWVRLEAAATPPSDPLLLSPDELTEPEIPDVILARDEALRGADTAAGVAQ